MSNSQEVVTAESLISDPEKLSGMTEEQIDAMLSGEASTEAEPKPEGAAEKEGEPKEGKTGEPESVLTRDGKHAIPFEVLDNERKRAAALAKVADEQAARIAALEEQVKTGKPQGSETPAVETISEEELKELEAEFPALGKSIRSQQQVIARLTAEMDGLKKAAPAKEEEPDPVMQMVQDAIDENPKLLALQGKARAWAAFAAIDDDVRADPKYQVPATKEAFAQRLADSLARYEDEYGAIALPNQPKPAAKPKPSDGVPLSLSEIPGGAPPAVDEAGDVEAASHADMQAKFASMTNDQINAYLANLAGG